MQHLSLVKSLSHLREEQKHVEEISLDGFGMSVTRGAITEIIGGASTGKTGFSLALLSRLTSDGEICAIVDAGHGFDPATAQMAGVMLEDLLWVRCGNDVEKAFIAADYLVQAKGFGCIWLNLGGLSRSQLRMVPRSYWFRYRTRIKETATVLLVTAAESLAGSASHGSFTFERDKTVWSGGGKFKLLREFHISLTTRKGSYGPPLRAKMEFDYTDG